MAAELSKLHVRYIQTQTTFSILEDEDQKGETFPLKQLYIKDKEHFYFSNLGLALVEQSRTILFNQPELGIDNLLCRVELQAIEKASETFESALLFFQQTPSKIKQIFLMTIKDIKQG